MSSKQVNYLHYTPPPKMLKEFLQEQLTPTPTHSSGFTAFPRRLPHPTTTATTSLRRSRSRSLVAAESALNKLISAVNSVLDKWSVKRNSSSFKNKGTVPKVKVKDILRWKSFRDAATTVSIAEVTPSELNSLQFNSDSVRSSTTTATTDCSDSCCSLELESGLELELDSNVESSCDGESDDNGGKMDELPCWWGNYFDDQRQMWDHDDDDVVATISGVGPNEKDNHNISVKDEKEQHSPVSVLNSPFREEISDHEFESSFDQSLANVERTTQSLFQRIQWLENLAGVCEDEDDETESLPEEESTSETMKMESVGRLITKFVRGDQQDKEVCITEMDKDGKWTSTFKDEKQELGAELQVELLVDLVNDVLVDLFGCTTEDINPQF